MEKRTTETYDTRKRYEKYNKQVEITVSKEEILSIIGKLVKDTFNIPEEIKLDPYFYYAPHYEDDELEGIKIVYHIGV